MTFRFFSAAVLLAAVAVFAPGPSARAQGASDATDLTVITSDKLTFDYQKRFALFEGNVVVVDPQMKLYADKMTVLFTATNSVSEIKAEGRVYIAQDDKQARSDTGVYNVEQGVIILTGKPQVTRGKDILSGDRITFWRDQNKMLVEPRARLVIHPQDGASVDDFMGGSQRGR